MYSTFCDSPYLVDWKEKINWIQLLFYQRKKIHGCLHKIFNSIYNFIAWYCIAMIGCHLLIRTNRIRSSQNAFLMYIGHYMMDSHSGAFARNIICLIRIATISIYYVPCVRKHRFRSSIYTSNNVPGYRSKWFRYLQLFQQLIVCKLTIKTI